MELGIGGREWLDRGDNGRGATEEGVEEREGGAGDPPVPDCPCSASSRADPVAGMARSFNLVDFCFGFCSYSEFCGIFSSRIEI